LGIDLRYFWYGNEGPAFARNRGIRDASADFIAFLDADDLFPPCNIMNMLNQLLDNPDVEVVRGYGQMMQRNEESGDFELYGIPAESYPGYVGAALYRKSVFRKVGLFDASMRYAEDTDWYMRATELGITVKWLDKVSLLVRRHGSNMTEGKNLLELNTLLVFKKVLDRMRRGESSY
jgi:glycosyltransferase involved in cell wall biosynthesis